MKATGIFLFVGLQLVSKAVCYNYLLVPTWINSHITYISNIGNALIARNHSVTMILASSFQKKELEKTYPGFKMIYFDDSKSSTDSSEFVTPQMQKAFIDYLVDNEGFNFDSMNSICQQTNNQMDALLEDTNFLKKIKKIHFDLAVVDDFVLGKGTMLVPSILGIPFVLAGSNYQPWEHRIPAMPSVLPNIITTYTPEMSFTERINNLRMTYIASNMDDLCKSSKLASKYTKHNDWPSLHREGLLYISARDAYVDYPTISQPNVILTGGLSATRKESLTNGALQKFADSSKRGLVIISFGSLITSLPVDIMEKFVEVFSRLSHLNFIMRHKRSDLNPKLKVPKNLLVVDWLPQVALLEHSKTILFITHCGNNGQSEAIYRGVPMLAFPIFAEQHYNAARVVYKKLAIKMNLATFKTNDLYDNIQQLTSPSLEYSKNARKYSRILKSLPMHSKELAAFWIEHVTEFGGDHLRTAAFDLTWYQYYMLDVAALIAALIIGTCAVILICFYICIGFIRKLGSTSASSGKYKQN